MRYLFQKNVDSACRQQLHFSASKVPHENATCRLYHSGSSEAGEDALPSEIFQQSSDVITPVHKTRASESENPPTGLERKATDVVADAI